MPASSTGRRGRQEISSTSIRVSEEEDEEEEVSPSEEGSERRDDE
jgi:hypothetical protein